jgi:hypothetical protein
VTDSERTVELRAKWADAAMIERAATHVFHEALRAGKSTPAIEQRMADTEAAQEEAWEALHRSMVEDWRRAAERASPT